MSKYGYCTSSRPPTQVILTLTEQVSHDDVPVGAVVDDVSRRVGQRATEPLHCLPPLPPVNPHALINIFAGQPTRLIKYLCLKPHIFNITHNNSVLFLSC